MKSQLFLFLFLHLLSVNFRTHAQIAPSFEEVLSLRQPGAVMISPDGTDILYSISAPDWEANSYDTEYWLVKDGGTPFQLTNTKDGGSSAAKWSPDGKWISFKANRDGKQHLYVISINGGEALKVTDDKEGIGTYDWSPDSRRIVYTKTPEAKDRKKQEERYGKYAVEDQETPFASLWLMNFKPEELQNNRLPEYTIDSVAKAAAKPKALIENPTFAIMGIYWSPDGRSIAINHQPTNDLLGFMKSDISVLDVETGKIALLVSNPASDAFADWSPDSKSILYESNETDSVSNFYKNGGVYIIQLAGKKTFQMLKGFDENMGGFEWTRLGIYGSASVKTNRYLYRIDPGSGKHEQLDLKVARVFGFSADLSGNVLAFAGQREDELSELYVYTKSKTPVRKLTSYTNQISDWAYARSEVISWKSQDDVTIEGVLHKPLNYEAGKKYPLLVVIHGGPTGVDRPSPVLSYVYPINQWLNKGAIVLRVNYRGSAGYGEKFRALNVRNLGVGDAWDVLSGVDYLVGQGIVDETRMGAMGWSQGGYISAFLTTNSSRFKAISVGAGISDWMTYYVSTDIHPFTRQYLQSTPWDDPEIYARTSPISNIKKATTPTLIQHGEFDRRVPIPNAYELYQGLQDVGVETKLIVYKGFGHGINKPKERLAAIWHNWQWFLKYVWGEEVVIPEEHTANEK